MKTPHPWEHIIIAFAQNMNVEIEEFSVTDKEWHWSTIDRVMQYPKYQFRIKPAMRSITLPDGTMVEWPEPMRIAPAENTVYWVVDGSRVRGYIWDGSSLSASSELKSGFCHLTEEAAQQHRKAIVAANGGEL